MVRIRLLFAICFCAAAAEAVAENFAGESALAYLKITRGGRLSAMGETGVAITNEPESMYANPANLAFQENIEVLFQNLAYIESINLTHALYAHPFDKFALGLGAGYLNAGSFDGYDSDNNFTGSFKAYDYDLLAGAAYSASDNLGFGVNLKYVSEKIGSNKTGSFAADVGLSVSDYDGRFVFGVSYLNLGPKVKYSSNSYDQPSMVRGGFSLNGKSSLLSLEALNSADSGLQLRGGVELSMQNIVFARFGYKHFVDNKPDLEGGFGFTAGLGVLIKSVGVDYAFVPYGDFGSAHRVSLKYIFGFKEY